MIEVQHDGDGTIVRGTTRADAATIKQVGGFKWSRTLEAWYLPRSWREYTRLARAKQLVAAFGDRAVLVVGDLAPSLSAEERAAQHVARAEELAERHETRAAQQLQAGNDLWQQGRDAVAGIPFGQPILVGHYSERRHRAALARSDRYDGKAIDAYKTAELEEQRARSSAGEARTYDDPPRVGRRIETNKAELGRWQRNLAQSVARRGEDESEWQVRARAAIADLTDRIARDQAVLEASGVTVYSKQTVKAGDLVKIRGDWVTVDKANPKTVHVTKHALRLPYPYTEIRAHRPAPTPEELRKALSTRHPNDLRDSLRNPNLHPAARQAMEDVLAQIEETA